MFQTITAFVLISLNGLRCYIQLNQYVFYIITVLVICLNELYLYFQLNQSVKQIYRLLILNMTVELHLKQWFSTDGLYKEENMQ